MSPIALPQAEYALSVYNFGISGARRIALPKNLSASAVCSLLKHAVAYRGLLSLSERAAVYRERLEDFARPKLGEGTRPPALCRCSTRPPFAPQRIPAPLPLRRALRGRDDKLGHPTRGVSLAAWNYSAEEFTAAGEARGAPEASWIVTVITEPLPRNLFWLPTSWADSEEASAKARQHCEEAWCKKSADAPVGANGAGDGAIRLEQRMTTLDELAPA